ncbi:MAG: hypothetical protein IJX36_07825 [Thermoguttaceae bacterium]|nr:hypothetical protein [Thermoguttaceae bacterium]MBQ9126663.1 hypothetical protein [Thermoguttaceae bacterium]
MRFLVRTFERAATSQALQALKASETGDSRSSAAKASESPTAFNMSFIPFITVVADGEIVRAAASSSFYAPSKAKRP